MFSDQKQNPQIYSSTPDGNEDLKNRSDDPTGWTVSISLKDSQSLKTSCALFPNDDKESEEEDCCGPAPGVLEERLSYQDSITEYIPIPEDQLDINISSKEWTKQVPQSGIPPPVSTKSRLVRLGRLG